MRGVQASKKELKMTAPDNGEITHNQGKTAEEQERRVAPLLQKGAFLDKQINSCTRHIMHCMMRYILWTYIC